MSKSALFVLLLAAGGLTPGVASGQGPMQLAISGPEPHFVAAWAPKKEREAERSAVLAGRVSLELRDVSLDAALKVLTNQAGLRITYSQAVLPAGKRVTISASDIAVVTAMTEMLFRSGLDVVVDRDGALALVMCRHPVAEAEAEVQDSGAIVGVVTDQGTGAPLSGAVVAVEGAAWSATTAADGRYRITGIATGTYTVRARFIGYTPLSASVAVVEGGEATVDFGLVKSVQKLDELVTVTPGGIQTQVKALPSPVSVISGEDIAMQRPQALADVIRHAVPSAVAFYSPALPVFASFSVRGVSSIGGSSAMKVLIDGVEAANFGVAPIDPSSIERIEVIRGPQAATVFGADAAGGVVQIFTKKGDASLKRPEVDLRAEGGATQTPYEGFGAVFRQQYAGSVRGGAAEGAIGYDFGASYNRLPNWVPDDELSRQELWGVNGGMRYASRLFSAHVHARYYPGTYGTVSNPEVLNTGLSFLSRPSFQRQDLINQTYGARLALAPTPWLRSIVTLGADRLSGRTTQTRPRLTTPDDTLFFLFDAEQSKNSIGINTAVTGAVTRHVGGSVTAGLDHYDARTSTFFTSQAVDTIGPIQTEPPGALNESYTTATNTGYFTQAEVNWREVVFLTAGLRAEQHSAFGRDFGTTVLPRIGASGVIPVGETTLKLRAAFGRAIRAPLPLQALGGQDQFSVTLANPLLAPEQQRGWDAGIDLVGDRGTFSATVYDQTAVNLVSNVLLSESPVPTFQYRNLGRVSNRGVELEATLAAIRWLRLTAQYAYVHSRIDDLGPDATFGAAIQVGDRPLLLPTHTAGASLTLLPRAGTTATAGLTYVGGFRGIDLLAQFRCFGGTGPCQSTTRDYLIDYPGFDRVTISIVQRLTPQLSGLLAINNLTNNLAFEGSNGLPVMGRTTMVGFHFHY